MQHHGGSNQMAMQGNTVYDDKELDAGGEKKSRRSKNDNEGRDFKCKHCDKTYLSYPALYTHSK